MENDNILGKQVFPIADRASLSGMECDKANGGMGAWLTGEKRRLHYKRAVDRKLSEMEEDNASMDWYVYSCHANGRYDLRTDTGYTQGNVSRDSFKVIEGGKTW